MVGHSAEMATLTEATGRLKPTLPKSNLSSALIDWQSKSDMKESPPDVPWGTKLKLQKIAAVTGQERSGNTGLRVSRQFCA